MAKRKQPDEPGVPQWVVTYGDLMSLLLTFFILLAAFSELKQEREYLDVVKSIKEAFGYVGGAGRLPVDNDPLSALMEIKPELGKINDTEPANVASTEPNVTGENDTVSHVNEGMRFVIGGNVTFAPGSAELDARAKQILRRAAEEIRGTNFLVHVVGHAYGVEDTTSGESLDVMGFRRAHAAMRFLVAECGVDPLILRPQSAGDKEPAGGGSFAGDAGAQSRRVQIIQTEKTIDELHHDPHGTGRSGR